MSAQWVNLIVWTHWNSSGKKMKNILRDRLFFFSERLFIIQALWYFSFICVKIKLHMISNVSATPTVIGRWPSWKWDNRYIVCCSGKCCSSTAQYFSIVTSRKQLNKNTRESFWSIFSISYMSLCDCHLTFICDII